MIEYLKKSFSKNKIIYFSYLMAFIMYVAAVIIIPGFGVGNDAKNLINESVILVLLALGQTFVVITGGIDLSIPWTLNSAAVLLTYLCEQNNWALLWVVPLILLLCSLVGFVNGIGVAYLKIPSIIMTLGVNSILQGALLVLLKGAPGGMAPSVIIDLSNKTVFGIPNLFIIGVAFSAFAIILLHKSTYGRKLYAVGNNAKVAYFSGVKVKQTIVISYVLSGLMAGVGGILFTGRLGQSYLGMGDSYLFMTLIIVVLGGTSMMGGSGSYVGTIAGAIILIVLKAFLSAINLSTSSQQILYGLILVLAVVLIPDRNRKRR